MSARMLVALAMMMVVATVLALAPTTHAGPAVPHCQQPDAGLQTPVGVALEGFVVCAGNPSSFTITDQTPDGGEVSANDDGTLSYLPATGFVGTFAFSVVADNMWGSSGEPVQITIEVTNTAPTCAAVTRTVRPLRSVSVTLSCADAEGHGITLSVDTSATNGTVVHSGTKVTYTARAGERTDTFAVIAADAWSSSTTTITITVARLATTTTLRQGTRTCGRTLRTACRYRVARQEVARLRGTVRPSVAELNGKRVRLTLYRRTTRGWVSMGSIRVPLSRRHNFGIHLHMDAPGAWRMTARAPATTGTRASVAHTYFVIRR